MINRVMFVIVLILETFGSELKWGDPCVTPNQETATCAPLKDCDVIYNAIGTFDAEAIKFFQASKCGTAVGLVCCGSSARLNNEPAPVLQDIFITTAVFSDRSVCGLDTLSTKIIGGTVAEFEEFPWLAALEYKSTLDNSNAGIRCGGSIITDRYVLTAAHCIVHVEFVVIKAWLGVTNISSDGNCLNVTGTFQCVNSSTQKFVVEKATPHPVYQRDSGYNDIGLLKLRNQIKYTDYIRPICIGWIITQIGSRLTVAGWGNTENHRQSDIKLKVVIPVQNASICNAYLKKDGKVVNRRQLCVGGERGKDSCQRDSGGPLMKAFINENGNNQWYQAGLVSYGDGCGGKGRPGVYISVPHYMNWIAKTISPRIVHLDRGDPCTTPDGKSGTCVPLDTCEIVFNAASSKNSTARAFATESHCGYDAGELVCCESPGSVIVPNLKMKALTEETACGVIREEYRISGGEKANLGEFPWMAIIEYLNKSEKALGCVGSLINNRYVLTTASCISNPRFKPVSVRLGEWKLSTDPDCNEFLDKFECADSIKRIPIKETIPHGLYDTSSRYHDIGLILLENIIEFTDYVSPVCLPFPKLPSAELGSHLTTAGWGLANNGNPFDILRNENVSLVSHAECFEHLDYIPNWQQLCAFKTHPLCNTDTGGPLMGTFQDKLNGITRWHQEGVLSHGECNSLTSIKVYTRVASYMDWIVTIISED